MLHVTTERPNAPQTEPCYLTPEDIQRELRLSKSTMYCILRSGEMPHVRFKRKIRVRREVFEKWCRAAEESSVFEGPAADQSERGEEDGNQDKERSAYAG